MQFFEPNEAIDALTRILIQKDVYSGAKSLGLFVSAKTPALADVLADYAAIECTVPGYARQNFTGSLWTGTTTSGISAYSHPDLTFTFTANTSVQAIYGVFGIHNVGGVDVLFGAVALPLPILIPPAGGVFSWTPTWGERSH